MSAQPYYTLKQLIIDKYGVEKFAIACEIVARWLSHETKKDYSMLHVLDIANSTTAEFYLDIPTATALCRLFNLNGDFEKLYTNKN